MKAKCYQDLVVWQEGIELVVGIYRLTKKLPTAERYALVDQMQRAAVSVPANIAEGHGRASQREFLYFLSISSGSLAELETHLTIAAKLAYLGEEEIAPLLKQSDRLGRRLCALRKSLQTERPQWSAKTSNQQPATSNE
jgi:four helix bundle protein